MNAPDRSVPRGAQMLQGAAGLVLLINCASCATTTGESTRQVTGIENRRAGGSAADAAEKKNVPATVTLQNNSGTPTLVKLIGPDRVLLHLLPGRERKWKVTPGHYHIKTRSGEPDGYSFAAHQVFVVGPSSNVVVELQAVGQRSSDWRRISETDFIGVSPRSALITGRIVDDEGKPIPSRSLLLLPWKDGKTMYKVNNFSILLNPGFLIEEEHGGRFYLALDLDTFADFDEFVIECSHGVRRGLLKTEEGALLVLRFPKELKKPFDLGDVTLK